MRLPNWLHDKAFRDRVRKLQDRLLRRTVGLLAGAGAKAVKALQEPRRATRKERSREAAADKIRHLYRGTDSVELTQWLELLEEAEKRRGGK